MSVHSEPPKIGPNDPCPCGSGKKLKKCCGRQNVRSASGLPSLKPKPAGHARMMLEDQAAGLETVCERTDRFDPRREAEYIIRKAQNAAACVVTYGSLVYFSTETGDAWVLDPEDGFAICLARDGHRLPFRIMETSGAFTIEWDTDYRIEGRAFVAAERSGRIRSILGYPTKEIERAIRRIP